MIEPLTGDRENRPISSAPRYCGHAMFIEAFLRNSIWAQSSCLAWLYRA